jgi:hypothetical protein
MGHRDIASTTVYLKGMPLTVTANSAATDAQESGASLRTPVRRISQPAKLPKERRRWRMLSSL